MHCNSLSLLIDIPNNCPSVKALKEGNCTTAHPSISAAPSTQPSTSPTSSAAPSSMPSAAPKSGKSSKSPKSKASKNGKAPKLSDLDEQSSKAMDYDFIEQMSLPSSLWEESLSMLFWFMKKCDGWWVHRSSNANLSVDKSWKVSRRHSKNFMKTYGSALDFNYLIPDLLLIHLILRCHFFKWVFDIIGSIMSMYEIWNKSRPLHCRTLPNTNPRYLLIWPHIDLSIFKIGKIERQKYYQLSMCTRLEPFMGLWLFSHHLWDFLLAKLASRARVRMWSYKTQVW